jgi:hypothetical protein
MVGRSSHERRLLPVRCGAHRRNLNWLRRATSRKGHEMRKYLAYRLSVDVRIDLAACLRATVVLIYFLT